MTDKDKITREAYDRLLDSHRANMGKHKLAAQAAGVSLALAKRVFEHGVGKRYPPISDVITQEMVDARVKLAQLSAEDATKKREEGKKDLVQSRAAQLRALKFSQANALAALRISGELLLKPAAMVAARVTG